VVEEQARSLATAPLNHAARRSSIDSAVDAVWLEGPKGVDRAFLAPDTGQRKWFD